jgi:hypothetical protein
MGLNQMKPTRDSAVQILVRPVAQWAPLSSPTAVRQGAMAIDMSLSAQLEYLLTRIVDATSTLDTAESELERARALMRKRQRETCFRGTGRLNRAVDALLAAEDKQHQGAETMADQSAKVVAQRNEQVGQELAAATGENCSKL